MIKILLCGCNGAMGQKIVACSDKRDDCDIVAGIDINCECKNSFPVYKSANEVAEKFDVIIDFSHPSALQGVLDYAVNNKIPAVIATTGLTAEQTDNIKKAAKSIPVFFTGNYSLGINLLVDLVKKAVSLLCNDFDIEVIEAHHNQKVDAPSGTANMIVSAIQDVCCDDRSVEYDRHSKRQKRDPKEIGVHSIRGGTIVGEHQIIFAGQDEIVTLSHSARSKDVFAVGALNAAYYLVNKDAGMYDMNDLINN